MSPVKILIVDDDPTIRSVLDRWLAEAALGEVHQAGDGGEGLEVLSETGVDLVLLDIKMPNVGGIEMLTVLRADPKLKDLEVVIISSTGSTDEIREAMRLKIADYIRKPLDREKSMARISAAADRILEKRRARAEAERVTRPKVLVADGDESFREFARTTLDTICHCGTAGNVGQLLVKALSLQPSVILLSNNLPGLQLNFMVKKLRAMGSEVHLLGGIQDGVTTEGAAGTVSRHFMPADFRTAVSHILDAKKPSQADETAEAGEPPETDLASLLSGIEPELFNTIQSVIEKATGADPKEVESPSNETAFARRGRVRLDCDTPQVAIYAAVNSGESMMRDFALSMLGVEDENLNDETLGSSLREVLSVIGGKIKSCCAAQQVDLTLRSPETGADLPETLGEPHYRWKKFFGWDGEQVLEVSVTAIAASDG